MDLGTLLLVALVLACPVAMFLIMRSHRKGADSPKPEQPVSVATDSSPGRPEEAGYPDVSRTDAGPPASEPK